MLGKQFPSVKECMAEVEGHDVRGVDTDFLFQTPIGPVTVYVTFEFEDIDGNDELIDSLSEDASPEGERLQRAIMKMVFKYGGLVAYQSTVKFSTDDSLYSDPVEHNAWTYYAEELAHNQLRYFLQHEISMVGDALELYAQDQLLKIQAAVRTLRGLQSTIKTFVSTAETVRTEEGYLRDFIVEGKLERLMKTVPSNAAESINALTEFFIIR